LSPVADSTFFIKTPNLNTHQIHQHTLPTKRGFSKDECSQFIQVQEYAIAHLLYRSDGRMVISSKYMVSIYFNIPVTSDGAEPGQA
jgi:hypothetical protein